MTENKKTFELTAFDLYPEIMNIYGDRGNMLYFKYRASLYGIKVSSVNVPLCSELDCDNADIIFMGGGQDSEQALIYEDLVCVKKDALKKAMEEGRVMLAVCGSYQLLCDYYINADGKVINGISIFKGFTESKSPRFTGNIATGFTAPVNFKHGRLTLVGFENHGGRTYLDSGQEPLGSVLYGSGNNGKDGTEGAITNNFFGTYLHGCFLPKNYLFCDYLLEIALNNKYQVSLAEVVEFTGLSPDDEFEKLARRDVREFRKIL